MEETKQTLPENPDVQELLKQIARSSRRQERMTAVLCGLSVFAAVCCLAAVILVAGILPQVNALMPQINALLPQVNETIPQINSVLEQMQTVLTNLEAVTQQLAQSDLHSMVSDMDQLVAAGQQTLTETMDKLNAIDFDSLNKAIANLEAVIEPLANFFKVFK